MSIMDILKTAFGKETVKSIAARSGVKERTITNWVSPSTQQKPNVTDLYAVCKAIKITMEQAIDGGAGIEYIMSLYHLSPDLTLHEQTLIQCYREMTDQAKEHALSQFVTTFEYEMQRDHKETAELLALSGIEHYLDEQDRNRKALSRRK
jgi:transcriptional regulator with XRE-family HTH domain